jgi:hypothetical protein
MRETVRRHGERGNARDTVRAPHPARALLQLELLGAELPLQPLHLHLALARLAHGHGDLLQRLLRQRLLLRQQHALLPRGAAQLVHLGARLAQLGEARLQERLQPRHPQRRGGRKELV